MSPCHDCTGRETAHGFAVALSCVLRVVLAGVLSAAPVYCADSSLLGAWELVSSTGIDREGRRWSWEPEISGGRSLKVFTTTHFAVVTHGKTGAFSNASAGPYELQGATLTEIVEESSLARNLGTRWVHHVAVSGELLTSSYVNPVSGARGREVWRRAMAHGARRQTSRRVTPN